MRALNSRRFYVYGLYRDAECLNPFYIGKGSGSRILEHEKYIEAERKYNFRKYAIIKNLLKTTGIVPKKIIYSELLEEKAFELEKGLILKHGKIVLGTGCLTNLCDGGYGSSHVLETIEKIRTARAKQVITAEHKAKIGEKSRGRKHTNEARKKISEANRGKKRSEVQKKHHSEVMLGKKHTDATRAKMSATRKGRKLSLAHAQACARGKMGLKRSLETRRNISMAKKGLRLSAAHKAAIGVGVRKSLERKKLSLKMEGYND